MIHKIRKKIHVRSIVVVAFIISAPLLIHWAYLWFTALPEQITVATGPVNGQWRTISLRLAKAIESRCGVDVQTSDPTEGSLQHLRLLRDKEVDFALYMRGSRRMGFPEYDLETRPMFVANLYPDVTLFLVRRDLYESGRLRSPSDLREGRESGAPYRVAVGRRETGEHSIARVILDYYFSDQPKAVKELLWDYEQVEAGFQSQTLDAALLTAGHQAPVFQRLTQEGEGFCVIAEIPEVEAIVMKNLGLTSVTIPKGLFRFGDEDIPQSPLQTISSQTMLLTHKDVESTMVAEVTKTLLSEDFIQGNQLYDLSRKGVAYAERNPEFPIHPGALHVYEPELKPLINPDFMEALESLRSFAVSLLIAGFLGYQWYRRTADQRKDHRLDQYFAELLAIDRDSERSIENEEEAAKLKETLERVIALRNEALREFSAKDFDEDSAADSFLSLCETIAAGIRSQLLRWDILQSLDRIAPRETT